MPVCEVKVEKVKGIVCPKCGGTDWKVRQTRPKETNALFRERYCLRCQFRLITEERPRCVAYQGALMRPS